MKEIGHFTISAQDSEAFARISGDFNPLHLSPVAARRTQFGKTLIHGICGTLKALDVWLAYSDEATSLNSLKVKFSKPASQDQELAVTATSEGHNTRLEVFANGVRCQIIDVETATTAVSEGVAIAGSVQPATPDNCGDCQDLQISDESAFCGSVDLFWDARLAAELFPNVVRRLPLSQLATVVATTQIVGMRCPGLHSVFAQVQLQFRADANRDSGMHDHRLDYQLLKTDSRINQVQLRVENCFAQGSVEAFFRSRPAQQAGFDTISNLVNDNEFGDQRALVIGGSRGLGEVIAKILAAGGASVMLTYSVGKDDAVRVAQEISTRCPAPTLCAYNVLEGDSSSVMRDFLSEVTHVYYLASPTIARSDSRQWNPALFTHYCDFYINGLATLMQQVKQHANPSADLALFIPSTVFLDNAESARGFQEYAVAKAAAEAFVQSLANENRSWRASAPRLPRLFTDQTSGLKNLDETQTPKVIISHLREASRQSRQG